jgi:GTP-binding protein YchF
MLRAGIVGLPNVGKSTLFNALTQTRKAEAGNYPFCTIDPNVGVVTVPDDRLEFLGKMSSSERMVPTTIEMLDIAGLVAGASQGEGLGNQFLSHIREVDAIVQVVRCFDDPDIHHVSGSVDPLRDIEVILTELILADVASLEKRKDKATKVARSGDKEARRLLDVIEVLLPHLDAGKPALTSSASESDPEVVRGLFLLTSKPMLFACNVREEELGPLLGGGARAWPESGSPPSRPIVVSISDRPPPSSAPKLRPNWSTCPRKTGENTSSPSGFPNPVSGA